jgi:hypothetical protein
MIVGGRAALGAGILAGRQPGLGPVEEADRRQLGLERLAEGEPQDAAGAGDGLEPGVGFGQHPLAQPDGQWTATA